jgi:hypothetical protein
LALPHTLIVAWPSSAVDGTVNCDEKYPLELAVGVATTRLVVLPWRTVIVIALPGLKCCP